jgi:hypothetical protein
VEGNRFDACLLITSIVGNLVVRAGSATIECAPALAGPINQ